MSNIDLFCAVGELKRRVDGSREGLLGMTTSRSERSDKVNSPIYNLEFLVVLVSFNTYNKEH